MWAVENYTQRELSSDSLSGMEGAWQGIHLLLLMFSTFVNDLDDGKKCLLIKLEGHTMLEVLEGSWKTGAGMQGYFNNLGKLL